MTRVVRLPLAVLLGLWTLALPGEEATSTVPPAGAVGSRFEGVIRPMSGDVPGPGILRLHLADFESNAPVEQARLELTLPDLNAKLSGKAAARLPGVYDFEVPAGKGPGRFAAILAISVPNGAEDLLAFAGIDVPGPTASPAVRSPAWRLLVLALALSVGGFLARAFVRSRRRVSGLAVLLVLATGATRSVRAHDPPVKGPATSVPGTRNIVTMPKETQFALGIRTRVVAPEKLRGRKTFPARLFARPDGKAEIVAVQAGRVAPAGERVVRLGDRVRKGEALLRLEYSPSLQERVAGTNELLAAEVRAEASAEEMRTAAAERERLDRSGTASAEAIGEARARLERARASFEAARPLVEELRRSLAAGSPDEGREVRYVLSSPIAGVVTRANVTLGEQVSQGKVLFTILDPSSLWASAEIYEKDIVAGAFLQGASASIARRDTPARLFPARFVARSYAVDPMTATASAVFEVDNPRGELLEGMLVDLHLASAGAPTGLAVPPDAVVEVAGAPTVFVHTGPEQFVARRVVLGASDGERVEVRSGLERGDRVVVSGATPLKLALLSPGRP